MKEILKKNVFSDRALSSKQNTPATNILLNEESFNLEIALPGFKKEEISINLLHNVLSIEGEKNLDKNKPMGEFIRKEHALDSFEKSFELSPNTDLDRIEASYKDGLLVIKLYHVNNEKSEARKSILIQ